MSIWGLKALAYCSFRCRSLGVSIKVEKLVKDSLLRYDVINLKDIPADQVAGLYKVGAGQLKLYRKSEEASIKPCVSIDYNRNKTITGWERLHIKMFGNCKPKEEYWGAGFLELIKNWRTFKHVFNNLKHGIADEVDDWPEYWREISKVVQNVRKITAEREKAGTSGSKLLDLISLYQAQVDGMLYGYNLAKPASEAAINVPMIYFVNFGGSLSEMKVIYDYQSPHKKKEKNAAISREIEIEEGFLGDFELEMLNLRNINITAADYNESDVTPVKNGHCNAFVKFLRDTNGNFNSFLFSHTTYDYFENTFKIIKSLEVNHTNFQSRIIFPSYPGGIWSGDDLYITEKGLLVTETTLDTENKKAYDYVQGLKAPYPDFMRLFAAIQLANSGAELISMMKETHTGSYTSQWMVVDMKKFEKSKGTKSLVNGTFYVIEQSTRRVLSVDLSQAVSNRTLEFWASFNIPYFKQISEDLNALTPLVSPDDPTPESNYTQNHRHKIYQKYANATNTIQDLQYLMRLNRFDQDKKINSDSEIASRKDLLQTKEMKYYGATDVKVMDYTTAKRGSFIAQVGPTWQDITPFTWPDKVYSALQELPKTYAFPWVEYNWRVTQPVQIIQAPRNKTD